MRRFFLIFLAVWLILPLFGWRSLCVFGWAKDGGGTISECVDTLTWVDEWWAYTYTYKGLTQTDTSLVLARGLTSVGQYHFFKLDRLFNGADSIGVDSIKCLFHWGGTANDSDTVIFAIDTLKPINTNNHYFYSLKMTYITGSNHVDMMKDIGNIGSSSFAVIRLYRRTGTHAFYEAGIVVFY